MGRELNEVELQVLSAVRDEGVPTNDVAVTHRTGLDREAVRSALRSLSEDYLQVEERHDDPVSDRVEVLGFIGDGAAPRPPTIEE